MTTPLNRQIVLARRPTGAPCPDDFMLIESPVPRPGDGQMLCRTIYLSLDPYMRGRMSEGRSYAKAVDLGQVMVGGTVSEVIESRHPSFKAGDLVVGHDGWQGYAVSTGAGVRTLDPTQAPIGTALGVLGMPGLTAYVGLLDFGRPRSGETVVVSAASGAVGSVVGQVAKLKGCRAVGIAGSEDKCRFVVDTLGFDACVSHRTSDLVGALRLACPSGIDVYFENVGGPVLDAVLRLVNPHPALWPHQPVQCDGAGARARPAASPRQPRQHARLHRLRSHRPSGRLRDGDDALGAGGPRPLS